MGYQFVLKGLHQVPRGFGRMGSGGFRFGTHVSGGSGGPSGRGTPMGQGHRP